MKKRESNLPKISIIVPSYNKVAYIKETMLSIVNQKYPNLEVIVQDGGSSDGTVEVIDKFAKKYPKIFKWVSKRDDGQLDAINKGLRKACGEIVTYINADDLYKDDTLLEVGRNFLDNPALLWVTGYGDIVDERGIIQSGWVTKYKNILLNCNNYNFLLMINYITQPSTFLSRKTYLKYGPFTGTKNYVMEYELWLKLGRVQMPKVIKKTISSFRLTPDNISSTSATKLLRLDNQIAGKYTKNKLLLFLHALHNLGRISLVNWTKN